MKIKMNGRNWKIIYEFEEINWKLKLAVGVFSHFTKKQQSDRIYAAISN